MDHLMGLVFKMQNNVPQTHVNFIKYNYFYINLKFLIFLIKINERLFIKNLLYP